MGSIKSSWRGIPHLIGRPGVNTTCDWSAVSEVNAPARELPHVRDVILDDALGTPQKWKDKNCKQCNFSSK